APRQITTPAGIPGNVVIHYIRYTQRRTPIMIHFQANPVTADYVVIPHIKLQRLEQPQGTRSTVTGTHPVKIGIGNAYILTTPELRTKSILQYCFTTVKRYRINRTAVPA